MADELLSRPTETADSYNVLHSGPIMVNYIPRVDGDEPSLRFAFQVKSGWAPLLCSTAQCFTRLICQSDAPIFIPSTVDVVAEGQNIEIFAPSSCTVKEAELSVVVEKVKRCKVPPRGIAVVYGADLGRFGERVEAVLGDNMIVYCEGGQTITVADRAYVVLTKHA